MTDAVFHKGNHTPVYSDCYCEAFEKRSFLFKFKEGDNFNHRNTLSISRITIWDWRRNWAKRGVLQRSLLIPQTIMPPAVRTLPGYTVARHSPKIFQHAFLANGKAAATSPAKKEFLFATITVALLGFAALFPISRSRCRTSHVQPLYICPWPHQSPLTSIDLPLPGFLY